MRACVYPRWNSCTTGQHATRKDREKATKIEHAPLNNPLSLAGCRPNVHEPSYLQGMLIASKLRIWGYMGCVIARSKGVMATTGTNVLGMVIRGAVEGCYCQGEWGGGIEKDIRRIFPARGGIEEAVGVVVGWRGGHCVGSDGFFLIDGWVFGLFDIGLFMRRGIRDGL